MKKRIKKATEQISKRVPVLWARFGAVSMLIARQFPLKSPPLLILSMPRSGSSWIGNVLGLSKSAAYLFEPISKSHSRRTGNKNITVFEILPENIPLSYKSAADNTFTGIPAFLKQVARKPSQWKIKDRKQKRLVVKDVNPLAVKWLIDNYKPRIIYITRHPAAVANSFSAFGWVKTDQFKLRFSERALQNMECDYDKIYTSFWSNFGALQAVITKMSMDALKDYEDCKIIKYEDVCSNPLDIFRQLYHFAELEWDGDVEEYIISQSTSKESSVTGEYGDKRNSGSIIDKWKREMDPAAIDEVKEAYLACDPPCYKGDEW